MLAALAACGGGGGDGGGSSNNPPPPPVGNPPTENDLIAITLANSNAMASTGLSYGEALLQLGHAGAEWYWDMREAIAGGDSQIQEPCPQGGTRRLDWQDRDNDLQLSLGDIVTVAVNDCNVKSLNDLVSGTLTIHVVRLPAGLGAHEFGVELLLAFTSFEIGPAATAAISTSDALDVTLIESAAEDRLIVDGGAEFNLDFSVSGTARRERYLGAVAMKRVDYTAGRYEFSFDGEVRSQLLPGRFSAVTVSPIGGLFGVFPDAGSLEIRGASNSRLRIEGVTQQDNSIPRITIDAGSGAFGLPIQANRWDSLIEGFPWWEPATGVVFPIGYPGNPLSMWNFGYLYWRLETPSGLTRPSVTNVFNAIVPVDVTVHEYFSGPVNAASVGAFAFDLDLGPRYPFATNRPGVMVTEGAMISVRPDIQLVHGGDYNFVPPFDLVIGENGGAARISIGVSIVTRDDLNARATRAAPVAIAGDSVLLDATPSSSDLGPIASFAWEQLSGPAVALSANDQATATFAAPAVAETQDIELKVTVTDVDGYTDPTAATVTVLPARPAGIIYIQHTDDQTGFQRRSHVTTFDAAFTTEETPGNHTLIIRADSNPFWRIILARRDGEQFMVGEYRDVWSTQSVPPRDTFSVFAPQTSCAGVIEPMSFVIREIEFTGDPFPAQALARLALDYTAPCSGSTERGSIRFNSAVPLPAM